MYTKVIMKQHHFFHHGRIKKKISILGKINMFIIIPCLFLVIAGLLIGFHFSSGIQNMNIPWGELIAATGWTIFRLMVAYILALVIGVPLAIWTQSNQRVESLLLPVFDVLESVPVLVFFPVVIVSFVRLDLLNTAAVFIIFLNMLWNIVFNVIGGLKAIPQDIFSVAQVFRISGLQYIKKIILPAIFPTMITGSILAWAEGWNMIIVAEVLHTYVPNTIAAHDLFGIGSILVDASANNHKAIFITSVAIIIIVIMTLNIFVWQRLLRYSERFKFE